MTAATFPFEAIEGHGFVHPPAAHLAIDLLALLRPASGAHEIRVRVVPGAQLAATLAGGSFIGLTPSVPVSAASLHGGWLVGRVPGRFFTTDTATPVRLDAGGTAWSIDFNISHTENPNGIAAPCDLWVLLGLHAGEPTPHTLRMHFPQRWVGPDGQETAHGDNAPGSMAAESFQLEFR